MIERFIIKYGKWGAYHYDTEVQEDMTLQEVTNLLNLENQQEQIAALRTPDEKCSVDQECRLILECDKKNIIGELQSQLAERTKDEIHALIEKYGEPQYKTSEFALYDVISVAQQLQAENTALREQLIQLCRVFHGEDCVCKWCNIVKERAAKGVGEMGFRAFRLVEQVPKPVEPKKPYNSDDYPLKHNAVVDKRDLRAGER
jgi:hypothetical protein